MKYILSGHSSFHIRDGWLNKSFNKIFKNDINNEIDINYFGKSKIIEAIDTLGMGSNMVESLRFWLEFFGIITKNKSKFILSELAKIIFLEDRYLENKNSLWLLHFNVFNKKDEKAVVWNIAFNKKYLSSFSREILEERVKIFYQEENQKIALKSIHDTVNVFLKTYYYDEKGNENPEENIISPFIRLNYLNKDENGQYKFRNINSEEISEYLIYYFIYKKMDNLENLNQITISEAYEAVNIIIKMTYLEFEKIIHKLEFNKMISVDRAAGLENISFFKSQLSENQILRKVLERRIV